MNLTTTVQVVQLYKSSFIFSMQILSTNIFESFALLDFFKHDLFRLLSDNISLITKQILYHQVTK